MKTSFIVICDDLVNVKMPKISVLGFFATLGYQINHIIVLSSDFLEQNLAEVLEDRSVVITPFDDEKCLQKLKSVLNEKIAPTSYHKREFGYLAKNANKICYLIKRDLVDELDKLCDNTAKGEICEKSSRNYKIFDFDLEETINTAQGIANIFGANFAYNYDCGDIILHYDCVDNNIDSIEQAIYNSFGDKIYYEGSESLLGALDELMTVQKRRLLILDYAKCDFLRTGLIGLVNKDKIEFLERKEFKNLDKAREYILDKKYDLLLVINKSDTGLTLTFIDEIKSQNMQIDFEKTKKYGIKGIFYQILYKILKKFARSTWNF